MKRIAIVVQRYAPEISGGAETLARLIAESLNSRYQVEVLTSCALDYTKWASHFEVGVSQVNGITVRRFSNPLRNDLGRARVPLIHKLRFKLRRLLRLLPGPLVLQARGDPAFDGQVFLRRQGPHCAGLLAHLAAAQARYDAVIFFTALYEPAALGIRLWGRRSVLVPLLHDEKPMYQPVFREVLKSAGVILFNTDSERRLAARMYGIDTAQQPIAGVGLDPPTPRPAGPSALLARLGLAPGYLIYVGRIDVAKGCRELIEAFIKLARSDSAARLVLVGQSVMEVPQHPAIVCTGFVSEAERDELIAQSAALVIPSRYESLSMVLLEAMREQRPVIANADCEVLADHIRDSGAGLAYRGRRQLVAALRRMLSLPAEERQRLGALGAAYVERHYTWPRVLEVFSDAIERASALPSHPVRVPEVDRG